MNDNAENTTVADTTGNWNGTALRNTSLLSVAGKINNAITNNGLSDYVSVSDFYVSNITVALWVNFSSLKNAQLLAKDGVIPNTAREWCISWNQTPPLIYSYFWQGNNGADVIYCYMDYTNAAVNTWIHFAVTCNNFTNRIYANGVFLSAVPSIYARTAIGPLLDGSQPVRIGNRNYGPSPDFFHGKMDDVRIYNRALTDAEIAAIYNLGNGTEQE
jgi:hypothetical protein